MTVKYKDVLHKLERLNKNGLGNEHTAVLEDILRERSDNEIDRLLEDKGDLKVILRSYY